MVAVSWAEPRVRVCVVAVAGAEHRHGHGRDVQQVGASLALCGAVAIPVTMLRARCLAACRQGLCGGLRGVPCSVFFVYGVALWYGAKLVRDQAASNPACVDDPTLSECFSGGKTIIVFFGGWPFSPRPHSHPRVA